MKKENRAIIIGGSLAGLFTGVLLRSIGWDVDIYERSPHSLDSRGGGIVLQADVEVAFKRAGISRDGLGVDAKERYYLQQDGSVEQMPMRQTLTSWNMLYGAMKRHLPDEHYHQGKTFERFVQDGEKVTVTFTDGSQETGDLLIGADGITSSVRQQLLPTYEPQYAGYVGYRGLVDESDLDAEAAEIFTERFVFYEFPNSHILQYVIPGENESLVPGERRFNWVWYVNYDERAELPTLLTDKTGQRRDYSVPPGMMAPAAEQQMRDYANKMLLEPFRKLVAVQKVLLSQ
ncbi:MAG: FAD-dependent monooxygenase, partial [Cyanobacteria bacterium J06626_6]